MAKIPASIIRAFSLLSFLLIISCLSGNNTLLESRQIIYHTEIWTITFYGAPDSYKASVNCEAGVKANDGSNTIAHAGCPWNGGTRGNCAGGSGSYANPLTAASDWKYTKARCVLMISSEHLQEQLPPPELHLSSLFLKARLQDLNSTSTSLLHLQRLRLRETRSGQINLLPILLHQGNEIREPKLIFVDGIIRIHDDFVVVVLSLRHELSEVCFEGRVGSRVALDFLGEPIIEVVEVIWVFGAPEAVIIIGLAGG